VAQRLALALSRLAKQVGKKTRGGIEISLSREELAQLTGTTLSPSAASSQGGLKWELWFRAANRFLCPIQNALSL
jgi:hypothetical protein